MKRVQTIAVIGPSADTLQFGGYSPHSAQGVSILDGITAFVAARAGSVDVTWAQGCRITEHNRDAYETEVEAENAHKNPAALEETDSPNAKRSSPREHAETGVRLLSRARKSSSYGGSLRPGLPWFSLSWRVAP